jgi:hypothetical protein
LADIFSIQFLRSLISLFVLPQANLISKMQLPDEAHGL